MMVNGFKLRAPLAITLAKIKELGDATIEELRPHFNRIPRSTLVKRVETLKRMKLVQKKIVIRRRTLAFERNSREKAYSALA